MLYSRYSAGDAAVCHSRHTRHTLHCTDPGGEGGQQDGHHLRAEPVVPRQPGRRLQLPLPGGQLSLQCLNLPVSRPLLPRPALHDVRLVARAGHSLICTAQWYSLGGVEGNLAGNGVTATNTFYCSRPPPLQPGLPARLYRLYFALQYTVNVFLQVVLNGCKLTSLHCSVKCFLVGQSLLGQDTITLILW